MIVKSRPFFSAGDIQDNGQDHRLHNAASPAIQRPDSMHSTEAKTAHTTVEAKPNALSHETSRFWRIPVRAGRLRRTRGPLRRVSARAAARGARPRRPTRG